MSKKMLVFAVGLLLSSVLLASCGQQEGVPEAGPETLAVLAEPAFSSTLEVQRSGKCLDVPRSSRERGADLIQYACHGEANQRFTFHEVAGKADTYLLKSEASGLCVDVSSSQKAGDDFVVHQWSCHAKSNQQFTLQATGAAEVFSLVSNHSGKCVSVLNASLSNRAGIVAQSCSGAEHQLWNIPDYKADVADSVTVVAAGDIACDPASRAFNGGAGTASNCRMKATADLIAAVKPDAVLTLGDNQYERATLAQFENSFDLSWGRFKSLIRPSAGSHEYYTSGASGYFRYFGAAAGDPAKGYYSYDLGAWHVVVLNTNCAAVGGCGAGSAQEQWLRKDLAANSAKCTLAYGHHPRYSSGKHGNSSAMRDLWQALYDDGAELLLSAHDHHYERFAPQDASSRADTRGVRQFVVGTGGKSLYAFQNIKANSQVRHSDTYGILQLTLSADSYTWKFLPEAGKSFTDSGSASCY
ncbi:MAG TPA: RICIN domain-containing protein [Chloroflexota bacterium]|nr:RICIN domain-containing protein [Chloroflexota bacterium]